MKPAPECVIVGGGLAGLTAAVALSDQGVRCTVLEGSSDLGGRARSWKDPVMGDALDPGPHILLSVYSNMLAFLRRLGTDGLIHWQSDGIIHQMDGERLDAFREAPLFAPFHMLPTLLKHPKIGLWDLLSIRKLIALSIGLSETEILKFDSITARELVDRYGSSSAMRTLMWDFFSMSLLNVPLEEASAAAFLRVVRYFSGTRDLQPGLAKVGLGELFTEQARAIIERAGGEVRLGARVVRVVPGAAGSSTLELEGGERIEDRPIILALAPQELRGILPQERVGALGLSRFEECPYVSTYLWFDRVVSERPFWARVHRAMDLNCDFYDLTRFRSGSEGRGSIITSNIIYSNRVGALSDAEVVAETRRELEENLPSARGARLLHAQVNRVPMAIHCPRPGTEALRPLPVPPGWENTGIVLAGDWIRTGLPSSMESACAAGYWAAEKVLGREGLKLEVRGPTASARVVARFFSYL